MPATARVTFPVQATQIFPTPQLTPTPWPTPLIPPPAAIEEHIDIRYTSGQKLDVYAPVQPGDHPLILYLHGSSLDKESAARLGRALAGQGAVVFIPDYQSYHPPVDRITRGPEEAACALRFARAHGPEYGGDPGRLILVGHSSGGAFGALVALAAGEFPGDCLVEGPAAYPDLFIGLDGAYDLARWIPGDRQREAPLEEWLRINPYAAVARTPVRTGLAFHLFVGREQELLQDAQAFRDALQAAGYSVTLTQFPGVDHMYIASGNHANTVWAIVNLVRP